MNSKLLIGLLIGIVLVSGCTSNTETDRPPTMTVEPKEPSGPINTTPPETLFEKDIKACEVDSDCISIKAGCCGCTAGGSNTAINKKFKEEWIKSLDCKDIACPAVMSNHPSCFLTPKCIDNECVLE